MADKKKSSESSEPEVEMHLNPRRYEELIRRLKEEREELQDELRDDYRAARGYVRSHPEEGVLFSFLGGMAIGFLFGKLLK